MPTETERTAAADARAEKAADAAEEKAADAAAKATYKVAQHVSWEDDAGETHTGIVVAVTPPEKEGDVPAKYAVAELPPATGLFFAASLKAV